MRLRVRYAKVGKVRFTSHRDTARMWERAMRRVGLPVAQSAGFTPRPRLSFGLALPTGAESGAEYLDVELACPLDGDELATLAERLTAALPEGIAVLAVAERPPGAGSLQDSVTSVTWTLSAPTGTDVTAVAARLLASASLPLERERKGVRAVDDVRPQILDLAAVDAITLRAELATTGRGLRPAELAALAFPDAEPTAVRAMRTHQWIDDGDRREVVALDGDVPPTSPGPVAAPARAASA